MLDDGPSVISAGRLYWLSKDWSASVLACSCDPVATADLILNLRDYRNHRVFEHEIR